MWITSKILVVNLCNLELDEKYWYDKIVFEHKQHSYNVIDNNFLLDEKFQKLTDTLIKNFHKISEEEYSISFGKYKLLPENSNICWAYVTNKNEHRGGIHHHVKTSIINSVFYLNMPSNNSGGISFYDDTYKRCLTYQPKKYDLIIFPNYFLHRPERINTEEYRISINMEIICQSVG